MNVIRRTKSRMWQTLLSRGSGIWSAGVNNLRQPIGDHSHVTVTMPCDTDDADILMVWTPTEARMFADKLKEMADEAESMALEVGALRGLLDAASTTADDAWAVLDRPAAVADAALAKLDAEGGEA